MGRDGNSPAVEIVLPLLAAVLLVTGACGAPAAKDEGRLRETTGAAGEKSNELSPSGRGMSPPDGEPDITGTITEVRRRDPGTNSVGQILVEEDPDVVAFSEDPDTEGWEKLYLEVADETRTFVRRGGDRGDVVAATVTDLAKGQTVSAWHTGHAVMESYPGQTVASEVVISPSSRTRPVVFFSRQISDSGDPMMSEIRGELTLDEKGCLRIEEPKYNTDSVPVWPAGFEVDTSGDETRVLDENGRVVGRVGERIYLGGGEIPENALGENDLMERPLLRELLERCPEDYWLVSSF